MNDCKRPSGKLITVCGIDGSGKTTLVHYLCLALTSKGFKVKALKPIITKDAFLDNLKDIKNIPHFPANGIRLIDDFIAEYLTLAFIHQAMHMVAPALKQYDYVICDRYLISHLVNQSYFGQDLKNFEAVWPMLPNPDLTFLLDLPFEQALLRINQRGRANALESEGFLKAAQQLYRQYALKYPITVLPGMLSEKDLTQLALQHILQGT